MSNAFVQYEDQISAQEKIVRGAMEKLFALHKARPPETVQDYTFASKSGPVKLSELFGDKGELILIHNMGKSCAYCTLWADGFNGFTAHLENRAGFVLANNDSMEEQSAFAASRGWKFRVVSAKDTTFSQDMGYLKEASKVPGVSVFTKNADGTILRRTRAVFGPGDVFSSIWSLFDLLPTAQPAVKEWAPKFSYPMKQTEPFRFSPNFALNVRDIDNAVSFYRDVLGFAAGPLPKDLAEGVPMKKEGMTFWLDAVSKSDEAKVGQVCFEFVVADLEASVKSLVAKGCAPLMVTTGEDHEGQMMADPFGMKFHLYKAKPKTTNA